MQPKADTIINLEKRFWKAIVDQDSDTAVEMLCEPALLVGAHGAMKFGHDEYRKMAEEGPWVLSSFELSDMDVVFPNESTAVITYHSKQTITPRTAGQQVEKEAIFSTTWVRTGDGWKCVVHTETPSDKRTIQ